MKHSLDVAIDIAKPIIAAYIGITLDEMHTFLGCAVLALTGAYTIVKIKNEVKKPKQ